MKKRIEQIMFSSPWWSVLLNPHFLPRRALRQAMKRMAPDITGEVLDVGCGIQPYRDLLVQCQITGLELESEENRAHKRADVFYDGQTFPFSDSKFQFAICNQVLEHVFDPERFLAEIFRILVPEGKLVLSVPFVWPEHEQPWDNARYTSFGLKAAIEKAGFVMLSHQKLVGGGAAIAAIVADQINRKVRPMPQVVRLFARVILIAPISMVGMILQMREGCPDFYLDNFVVAIKPERG